MNLPAAALSGLMSGPDVRPVSLPVMPNPSVPATRLSSAAAQGLAWGLTAATIWAGYAVLARLGIKSGLAPVDLTLLRFLPAGLVMAPLLWRWGWRDLGGIGWRRGLVLTLLAGPGFSLLFMTGFSMAPLAHGAVIAPACQMLAGLVFSAWIAHQGWTRQNALGAGLVFSVLGGVFGVLVLSFSAPALAEVALNFSSFEYFWLVMLGFTCAIFIAGKDPVKGIVALLLGLLISVVGLENPAGAPRYTFGNADLMGGIELIPLMIGMFAVSEILRYAVVVVKPPMITDRPFGNVFAGMWGLVKKYPLQLLRGAGLGTLVGALPGAGADIAAWMAYAISKRFSKEPEKFGTGHPEGIVEAGGANNSALGGAWIPALVFGIPGDSITAIAIGVLYLKGMNPGPTLFINNPQNIYAVFIIFMLAQFLMLPLGWMAIKVAKRILGIPAQVLMPLILLFCVVGAFAINNSAFGIIVMLAAGVLGFFMERFGFPIAPTILGVVLGTMLEQHFFSSLIKADGNFLVFFERPIAGALGAVCVLI